MAKDFHLGDVLTVTTDRMLSPRGMEGVYDILNYMTGDSLFTHQLPRAVDECKPRLLMRYPHLSSEALAGDLHTLDGIIAFAGDDQAKRKELIMYWLNDLCTTHGTMLPVEQIQIGEYLPRDPLLEAEETFGKDRVVAIGRVS